MACLAQLWALWLLPALQLAGRATGKAYRSVVDGMFASPNRLGKDAARDAIKICFRGRCGYCRSGNCYRLI
jgi:hypothetical protein